MEEGTDRERILALEIELRNLRTLLEEQRAADRSTSDLQYKQLLAQHTALATAADRYALATSQERSDARLKILEEAVSDFRANLVPRAELQLRLESVTKGHTRLEEAVNTLSGNYIRLSEEFSAEEDERVKNQTLQERKRTFVVGILGLIIAALAVFVPIFRGDHTKVIYTPVTTTTVAR